MADSSKVIAIIEKIIADVDEQKLFLTELDNVIGDGDHGINLARGFDAVKDVMPTFEGKDIGAVMKTIGMKLVSTVGGASGPLYGTAFMKAGAYLNGKQEMNMDDFIGMMEVAIDGIQKRGKAVQGEKTMLDAMIPAYEAMKASYEADADVKKALDAGVAAAVPSGFLGGLLAGFVGGWIMLMIEKACDKLPHSLEGIKPVLIYPLLGLGAIAVIMCAVNPIMGWINTGMTNALTAMSKTEGLMVPLCALLAGMMAIDMGGPFNKAAYVFATGMLSTGTDASYMIMAAVMVGGMVPPIAIALSTTFNKNRWTAEERKNGTVNYIMGLSFITEGAIPYAAGHPLQVIPACIVGSASAGALSALFGCKLMAPHGGIFVFATMSGTWYWYILALAVGSFISMILLALFMKKKSK